VAVRAGHARERFLLLGMVLVRRHASSYDQPIEAHARKGSLSICRSGPRPRRLSASGYGPGSQAWPARTISSSKAHARKGSLSICRSGPCPRRLSASGYGPDSQAWPAPTISSSKRMRPKGASASVGVGHAREGFLLVDMVLIRRHGQLLRSAHRRRMRAKGASASVGAGHAREGFLLVDMVLIRRHRQLLRSVPAVSSAESVLAGGRDCLVAFPSFVSPANQHDP